MANMPSHPRFTLAFALALACGSGDNGSRPSMEGTDMGAEGSAAPAPSPPRADASTALAVDATPDLAPPRDAPGDDVAPRDAARDAGPTADTRAAADGPRFGGTPDPARPDLVCKSVNNYSCIDYCNCMATMCTGKNERFTSNQQCLDFCHGLGKVYAVDPKDPGGKSLFCWLSGMCQSMINLPTVDKPEGFCRYACPGVDAKDLPGESRKAIPCPPPAQDAGADI